MTIVSICIYFLTPRKLKISVIDIAIEDTYTEQKLVKLKLKVNNPNLFKSYHNECCIFVTKSDIIRSDYAETPVHPYNIKPRHIVKCYWKYLYEDFYYQYEFWVDKKSNNDILNELSKTLIVLGDYCNSSSVTKYISNKIYLKVN